MTEAGIAAGEYTIRPLDGDTWDAFAAFAARHNGVWGGCWCTWFHTFYTDKTKDAEDNRTLKERLVREGRAHAALVFHGGEAVAWCEYGTPDELPNIYHRKQYEAERGELPDYRLTCFFVDKRYRHKGLGALALRGALDLIAQAGGGIVEGYPQEVGEKKVSSSFLYNGTRHMFEAAGFTYDRPKGTKNMVMIKTVAPA